ncbi:GumC family protein, partial [Parabacteroides merdae]|uniref:GumC family protein n=5 Tax=Bacteroidia TaxID=200643 RepID=UPI0034A3B435
MAINQKNIKPGQQDDFLRIQDLLYLCLARWKWFVLSLMVTIGVATVYLLRTPAVYTRTASVLIKEDSKGKSVSSDLESFSEFGLFQSGTNVNNELITFQSPALMTEVVKRLRLDMNYFVPGKFHRQVAYGLTLPVDVTINDLPENESAGFTLKIQPDGTLYLSDFIRNGTDLDEKDVKGSLLDSITTPLGKIIIHTTPNYVKGEAYTLYVGKSSLYNAVNSCSSNLSVSLNSEKASVIDLSFKDNSTQRAEDVLSMLISVYNENWVKDKNQIAVSTSMFINERLGVIERELGNVDEDISSYKSEHLLPDVQAASSMYMAQSSEANAQILSLNNQLYMTRYIRNYLANDANRTQLLPANSGIESANIESQIAEYNKQLLQRNSLVANSSTENPLVVDMDQALASMRGAIIRSIDNQIVTLNSQIKSLRQTEQQTTSRIAANPTQAKYLLSVERQQKVKEALYLFLLQKREENELSQAFTAYNTRIVTPPHGSMLPTSPVHKNIFMVAFALGLLIPVVIIFMRENMNTRVRGRKDLENLTIPFIGEIPLFTRKKKGILGKKPQEVKAVVVKEGNRDIINEAFRVLRTNLEFMTGKDKTSNVIIMTSFNPGSGKSFLTMNIAMSLAIKGKKVLVIDGDLRHASASSYIDSPDKGLSDYLGGRIDNLDEIIVPDPKHKSMDILPVGTIPPNPTELLFDERLKQTIDTVREQYDYV